MRLLGCRYENDTLEVVGEDSIGMLMYVVVKGGSKKRRESKRHFRLRRSQFSRCWMSRWFVAVPRRDLLGRKPILTQGVKEDGAQLERVCGMIRNLIGNDLTYYVSKMGQYLGWYGDFGIVGTDTNELLTKYTSLLRTDEGKFSSPSADKI